MQEIIQIDGFIALYIFMLAGFVGYEIIGRVPAILHTPLMSGSNFIDCTLSKSTKIIGISRSKEYRKIMLPYKFNKNLDKFKFFQLNYQFRP